MFPFMAQADRGVETRVVPLDRLAEEIDERTDVVAASLVQSSSGEVLDLDAVIDAARAHDALVVIDAIQGCGWLPFDASRADVVAAHGYKWLCSPRGSAFMYVRPELRARMRPSNAGWYAGDDPYASYYGPPMTLSADARSLDTSPAWFSWVGTEAALQTLLDIGSKRSTSTTSRSRTGSAPGLGLEPSNTAIVTTDGDASALRGRRDPRCDSRRRPAAPPSTSTTPRPTWTPRSKRSLNARGRPEAAPRFDFGCDYGLVTVNVCTTCVLPGVTFDVIDAIEPKVPLRSAETSQETDAVPPACGALR